MWTIPTHKNSSWGYNFTQQMFSFFHVLMIQLGKVMPAVLEFAHPLDLQIPTLLGIFEITVFIYLSKILDLISAKVSINIQKPYSM